MSSLARYFVFQRNEGWLVTLDGAPVGRHATRASALNSAIVMADLMGSMRHEADVMVEADGELNVAWTYGIDPVPLRGSGGISNPITYLWHHPRRTGFVILNVAVLVAFLGWGTFTAEVSKDGVGALPTIMLGYTGMALLVVLWVVAWLAWAWLIARRQIARHHG